MDPSEAAEPDPVRIELAKRVQQRVQALGNETETGLDPDELFDRNLGTHFVLWKFSDNPRDSADYGRAFREGR